jgi:hypothetical protein
VSVSTCGGLIHRGLIFGGAYSRRFTVYDMCYGSKVTATFITIKQATKQLQNE